MDWPHDSRKRLHAVARIVDAWCALGLAQKERPILDQPMWVWTSSAGLRALGLLYQDAHFYDAAELTHLYQVTQVRLELARASQVPAHTWISERALAATLAQERAHSALPVAHAESLAQSHRAEMGSRQVQRGRNHWPADCSTIG